MKEQLDWRVDERVFYLEVSLFSRQIILLAQADSESEFWSLEEGVKL